MGNNLLALAGRLGINVEGSSEAAAAQALISNMIPNQRVAGSGTTSDFDAKMFERAVPSLSGTHEGNRIIIQTMRALAEDQVARADIANRALFSEITPQEARQMLHKMPSPSLPPMPGQRVNRATTRARAANPAAVLEKFKPAAGLEERLKKYD